MSIFGNVLIVWNHRLLVVGLWLCAVLAAAALSVLLPKSYESTATILAPKESSTGGVFGAFAASALLQQIPMLSTPSLTPNRDMVVSILKSRTIAQMVAERFRLQERYRTRYSEDAIRHLISATTVSVSKEGTVAVKVEDADPRMAADMANHYVEQLDRLVSRYATGEASRQHRFLTEQVARARADLEASEASLRRFQERNRAISLQDQTKGAIEAAARLKGEVMAAEVQLQVMRNFATEANPEVASLRRRVDEMNRQLAQLQHGSVGPGSGRDFAVPFPRVPEVGIELVRLTRDVKVAETLVTLLTQQLEQAKIAEARDLPIVQVLDRAVPAERHARPRLVVNVSVAAVASLLAGTGLAFFLESFRNARVRARAARPR